MRNVVFVAPFPLSTTLEFARALSSLDDVRLLGVFQEVPRGPGAEHFADIALVDSVFDAGGIAEGVRRLAGTWGLPHRILGVLEELQGPLALARQELGVPGPGTSGENNGLVATGTCPPVTDATRPDDGLRA